MRGPSSSGSAIRRRLPARTRVPTASTPTSRRGLALTRHRERERGAVLRDRVDVQRPTVGLRDRARDEQAEPGARPRVAARDPAELLEDQPPVLVRDPWPVVAHVDVDVAVLRVGAHLDLVSGRRLLDRVVDEVHQHLAKALGIAADARQRPTNLRADSYLV